MDGRSAKSVRHLIPRNTIAAEDESGWDEPRQYLRWFMKRYANDERLFAIEVMNEPSNGRNGSPGTLPIAKSMFTAAESMQGTVPLTLGTARIEQASNAFIPLGLAIIQFHNNFPRDTDELVASIKAATALGQKTGLPVWFTEWQRLRTSATGFNKEKISPEERGPGHASMAATIRQYSVSSFFWVKRAYVKGPRLMVR